MAIIHNLIARFRADTGTFDRNIKKSRTHMTRFGRDVQRMGKQLLAVAGVGGGIYMLNRGLRSVVSAALIQEKAERDLMAATNQSIGAFKKYAAEIQKLTIYGDEQILTQMAYAKNLGVTVDQLEAATTAAIGLAAKYRLDLATSMMLVGRASQGQTQMLTRYGIILEESLSDQEKFNAVLKIGAEAFGLAEAEAATAAGSIDQMKNAIGDTAETIGDVLLPTIAELSKGTTKFLQENSAALKRYISDYVDGVKTVMKYLSPLGMAYGLYKKAKPPKPTVSVTPSKPVDVWGDISKRLDATNIATAKQDKLMEENVAAIRTKYIPAIRNEIELIGRLSEAREHARQIMKLENELKADNLDKTKYGIALMKEQKFMLKELEGAERLAKIADTIGDSFANAFEQAVFEAKKAKDIINSIIRDIARSVMRNLITQPLGMAISGGIGRMLGMTPATVAHSGGKVGSIAATRRVPAMAFAGAPKLHGGLAGDEYPAILQRGEQVIPRGGGGMAPTIIVNNNTGQKMRQENEPMFDGKQWVIRIVTDDIQQGGPLRKMVQGLR